MKPGNPFHKVLVANRGEIARRILRTCHAMRLDTVAVFSDADRDMPHVGEAGEAVRLGPAPSAESYLCIERIVRAATRVGAGAVHPGYGFLAENADFARACVEAGLVFIGPSASTIRAMGSKREARRIAVEAGVPVVPGYDGERQDTEALAAEARKVGLPVLVKASAGGGGKGMRVVHDEAELEAAIDAARRESEASFSDGTLLIEKYVEAGRHVEVQILGDAHGGLIHLYERECSVQRRHQKIVEETPSPALDDLLRSRVFEAAIRMGSAIGYVGAGTVEFLLAPDGSLYLLEVNTRLQVEHPVTEMTTGIDLVAAQIHIARGEEVGLHQGDVHARGASIECRLYAEDPARGFLPEVGLVRDFHLPLSEGIRVDSGVSPGTEVAVHYDPLLAKVITHGRDREEARCRMLGALRALSVQGVGTNRELLLRVLDHPNFVSGRYDAELVNDHLDTLSAKDTDPDTMRAMAIVATLTGVALRDGARRVLPHVPHGYRNVPALPQSVTYGTPGGADLAVEYTHRGSGRFAVTVGGSTMDVRLVDHDLDGAVGRVTTEVDGLRRSARVTYDEQRWFVSMAGRTATLLERPRFPEIHEEAVHGGCIAPMPGKITGVCVRDGDAVTRGQVLVIMEAMKMEHPVTAPDDGVVEAVRVEEGEQVDAGAILVVLCAS